MAYFHFPVAGMTYDIDPWCDLDLELQKQCHQRIPRTRKPRCRAIICFHMMTGYCGSHFKYAN